MLKFSKMDLPLYWRLGHHPGSGSGEELLPVHTEERATSLSMSRRTGCLHRWCHSGNPQSSILLGSAREAQGTIMGLFIRWCLPSAFENKHASNCLWLTHWRAKWMPNMCKWEQVSTPPLTEWTEKWFLRKNNTHANYQKSSHLTSVGKEGVGTPF